MIDVIISTVKWFDQDKGYGFIGCELGDVFVHYSEIKSKGFKTLKKGDKVKFELCKTEKGLQAKVVTLVESGNQNANIINNHNN